jgi:hypothetical protein
VLSVSMIVASLVSFVVWVVNRKVPTAVFGVGASLIGFGFCIIALMFMGNKWYFLLLSILALTVNVVLAMIELIHSAGQIPMLSVGLVASIAAWLFTALLVLVACRHDSASVVVAGV